MEEDKKQERMEETARQLDKMAAKGEIPYPRSLTRKERRQMNKDGMNPFDPVQKAGNKRSFLHIQDEAYDYVLDNFFPDGNWDNISDNVCRAFAVRVLSLTYQDTIAEKN